MNLSIIQKNIKKFVLPVFLTITALAAVAGAVLWLSGRGEEGQQIYEKAPNFLWLDLEDKPVVLEMFRGKIVVLNFWAGWCVWCVREMPALEKLSQEFRDRGLVVLGVHRTDTEAIVVGKKFAEGQGVTYQLLKDRRGDSFMYFAGGIQTMPTSAIIDRSGFVREVIFGYREEEQWRALLEPVLNE